MCPNVPCDDGGTFCRTKPPWRVLQAPARPADSSLRAQRAGAERTQFVRRNVPECARMCHRARDPPARNEAEKRALRERRRGSSAADLDKGRGRGGGDGPGGGLLLLLLAAELTAGG